MLHGCPSSSSVVASKSSHKPHFVSLNKDGHFECDDSCASFLQRYICAHSVAAVEKNGLLKSYIKSYGSLLRVAEARKVFRLILQEGCQ